MGSLEKWDTLDMRRKAFILAGCFTVYAILVSVIFMFWSAFVASYILILTFLSGIIYLLMSKETDKQELKEEIFEAKETDNISKLLRYATAVLSFVSLMTTAKGFQNYVFAEEERWISYLASFAVQVILICFSLAYCHFFSMIVQLPTLSERGKSLILAVLTLFLAASLAVSSSFSFSYIANNAYKLTWADDSEMLIEKHLRRAISDLNAENERIGELVYGCIKERNGILNDAMEGYIDVQDDMLKNDMEGFSLSEYDLSKVNEDYGLSDDIVEAWKRRYSRRAEEIEGLVGEFRSYAGELALLCEEYNKEIATLNADLKNSGGDWQSVDANLNKMLGYLEDLSDRLVSLKEKCEELLISAIDKDIAPYRNNLKGAVALLEKHVGRQIENTREQQEQVNNAINGYSSDASGNALPNEIKQLQKEIYMLNAVRISDQNDSPVADGNAIVDRLSGLLADYLNEEILDNNTVEKILELEELVKEYQVYIDLAGDIDRYTSENLAVTYNIVHDAEEVGAAVVGSGAADSESAEPVSQISYEEWKASRNKDFLEFFSMLKEMPAEPSQEIMGFDRESSGADSVSDEDKVYRPEEVLYELNILRRNLLGEITDFERAFIFFKYDFKFMAGISAFIAAFFDLGAFCTGCFLYTMRHIMANKK